MDLLNFDYDSKNISMTSIALKMFFVVTVPVILGMVIRRLATDFIINNSKLIQKVSVILFIIVFAAIWIEEWDNVLSFITRAGTIALCLNLIMMTIGFYVAKFFTSGLPQQKCISLECGLQNGTLAAFVGTQLFDKIVFIVPAAAYALVMMTTSIIFVLILRKQS
tara:strand:- start:1014 stop:1508 length:495 start_codon:yes stop_codon:yes gene_type:complete